MPAAHGSHQPRNLLLLMLLGNCLMQMHSTSNSTAGSASVEQQLQQHAGARASSSQNHSQRGNVNADAADAVASHLDILQANALQVLL
jgi:hypothetical protein